MSIFHQKICRKKAKTLIESSFSWIPRCILRLYFQPVEESSHLLLSYLPLALLPWSPELPFFQPAGRQPEAAPAPVERLKLVPALGHEDEEAVVEGIQPKMMDKPRAQRVDGGLDASAEELSSIAHFLGEVVSGRIFHGSWALSLFVLRKTRITQLPISIHSVRGPASSLIEHANEEKPKRQRATHFFAASKLSAKNLAILPNKKGNVNFK